MKLVACPECRAQYDVDGVGSTTFSCRCGATVSAVPPPARDAAVGRCAACGALIGDADRVCSYCRAAVERVPAPAGPVCPECYARNPERARHCTSCGIAFAPQPVRSRSETLRCPVCPDMTLAGRNVGGVWLEECARCQGLWAPGDVLDRLVAQIRERREGAARPASAAAPPTRGARRAAWQGAIAYRRCPECGGLMARKNVGRRSGIIVDRCVDHGTWLDSHEMEDIAAFALEGGLDGRAAGGYASDPGPAADPKRIAALVEAEKLMAEERARTRSRVPWTRTDRPWKGITEFLADLLK